MVERTFAEKKIKMAFFTFGEGLTQWPNQGILKGEVSLYR
jgi:hypothetical protein